MIQILSLLFIFSLSTPLLSSPGDIPFPFFEVQEDGANEMMLVNDGVAALQLRLEMIRRARHTIEVEYFIYKTDLAAKVLTRELIRAAQRGVRVRILVDKAIGVLKLNRYYAKALADHGIEVRYYNDASIIHVSSLQFRNHRKLLVIDDLEALTGGRNIGDEYFDLSPKYNFYDRDIFIKGPLVKTMRMSFDEYFEHPITRSPRFTQVMEKKHKKWEKVAAFLAPSDEERELLELLETSGRRRLAREKLHACPVATFASDAPGARFFKRLRKDYFEKFRHLPKVLYEKIAGVKRALTVDTPYMIHTKTSRRLFHELFDRAVEITLYTNSLGSTDAVYVSANMYLQLRGLRRQGVNVYLHDGSYLGENPELPETSRNARWGTHSKSQVYESEHSSELMVGTYNMDNRSRFYNNEMAVFCRGNDDLTKELKNSISQRTQGAIKVTRDFRGEYRNGESRSIFSADRAKVYLMRLITPPSWLLKFLL